MTERSEVVNPNNLSVELQVDLQRLKSALDPLVLGQQRDHEDESELYHQLNDLLGLIIELSQEDGSLGSYLEDEF